MTCGWAGGCPQLNIGDRNVAAPISVGIALYPQDGRDGPALIAHADRAMYLAKAQRRRT